MKEIVADNLELANFTRGCSGIGSDANVKKYGVRLKRHVRTTRARTHEHHDV